MKWKTRKSAPSRAVSFAILALCAECVCSQQQPKLKIVPSQMTKIGTVDERFLSYNVEMVEVTGGRFWKPYKDASNVDTPPQPDQEVGGASALYQYRSPSDLSNARLRKLTSVLGPAYLRVSGTWANSTYFQKDDNPSLQRPPAGFKSVLTRAEWKGVPIAVDGHHSNTGTVLQEFNSNLNPGAVQETFSVPVESARD
jgi:hypothetical protein